MLNKPLEIGAVQLVAVTDLQMVLAGLGVAAIILLAAWTCWSRNR